MGSVLLTRTLSLELAALARLTAAFRLREVVNLSLQPRMIPERPAASDTCRGGLYAS